MKRFACGAVVPGCGKVFYSEDEDGVLAQVAAHAAADHGIAAPPPELVAAVRACLIDV